MFARAQTSKLGRSLLLADGVPATMSSHSRRQLASLCGKSGVQKSQKSWLFGNTALCGGGTQTASKPPRTSGHSNLSQPHQARFISSKSNSNEHTSDIQINSTRPGEPTIHGVFETDTSTWQYLVADPASNHAVIIDPVLDYDPATQTVRTATADSLLKLVKDQGYTIDMILETHVHADHMTAASYIRSKLAQAQSFTPPIGIGKRIEQVQKLFSERYGISKDEWKGVFGKYLDDDETIDIGQLKLSVLHLPGHTPDHVGYRIGDNVFCGDSVFHADIGTARCDFPGGSAHNLFQSGRKLFSLPDQVKLWPGHDYPPEGREGPSAFMSVQDHRRHNKHLMDGTTEATYVALRQERDAKMAAPRLIHPSLQLNLRAGRLPNPAASGYRLLHLPMTVKGSEW